MKHLRIAFIVIVGLFIYTLVLTSITRVVFTHPDQGARYFGNVSKLIVPLTDISKNIKAYLNPEYLIDNIENGDGFTYLDWGNHEFGRGVVTCILQNRAVWWCF